MDDDLDEEATLDYGGVLPVPVQPPDSGSPPSEDEASPTESRTSDSAPVLPPTQPHTHLTPASGQGLIQPAVPVLPPTQPHTHIPSPSDQGLIQPASPTLPPTQPHTHLAPASGVGGGPLLPPTQPHTHLPAPSGFGASGTGLSHSLDPDDENATVLRSPVTHVGPSPVWNLDRGPTNEDDEATVKLSNRHLDRTGHDTQLARFLGKIGRLDVPTLQAALIHARAQRGRGVTLARALVTHGHLSPEEAAAFLRHVTAKPISESGEFEPPTMARAPSGSSIMFGDAWGLGEQVGDYRLVEKLGAGGMGIVYKGEDTRTGQAVAIKTLTPVEDPEFLARFRREGQAQSRLDHPNLVRVHSWGEHRGRPYLVMDFVEGEDLSDLLRNGPFDPREAARVTRDVASAVAHLHDTGVLHRDLKPSNILIDGSGRPRLVDFGVARLDGAETLTRTGDVLGTPAFMSPEQALGEREAMGPKTDVYSLCAVLYNLLTGSPPFRGASAITMLTQVVQDDPPQPRAIVEDVPEDLEAICLRGMSKDPEERFTAKGLVEVLDGFLSGERLDPKERSASKSRGGLALAFVLFVGGVGLGLWGRGSPDTGGGSPTPRATLVLPAPSASETAAPTPQLPSAPGLRFASQVEIFELEVSTDVAYSRFGDDQSTLDMKNLLTMAWRARKLENGHWSIDAEVEALVVDWGWVRNGSSEGMPPMHYDSRRTKEGAFSTALGRRFSFDLDPKTGDVDHLYGVAAIQSAVLEAAGEDAWRHRAPVFRPAALENLLESLFRGPTLQLTPGEWKLSKGPPSIFGNENDARERDESGLKRTRPPPVELTYVRRRGTLDEVQWGGRSSAKTPPYSWIYKPKDKPEEEVLVESTAKREVSGKAFFSEEGVPSLLELNETTQTLRTFRSAKGVGGREVKAPTESKSIVRLRRRGD